MIRWLLVIVLGSIMVCAQWVGYMTQPWARWYVSGGRATSISTGPIGAVQMEPSVNIPGRVTDVERYQLARAAGWNPGDAVIATAISMAENGAGDPTALSGLNSNGSYDFGLWQINSAWWPQFGGRDALALPLNNARAAHAIYLQQHWCAWSTYLASCGVGHTGSYAAYLTRAQAAALRSSSE